MYLNTCNVCCNNNVASRATNCNTCTGCSIDGNDGSAGETIINLCKILLYFLKRRSYRIRIWIIGERTKIDILLGHIYITLSIIYRLWIKALSKKIPGIAGYFELLTYHLIPANFFQSLTDSCAT